MKKTGKPHFGIVLITLFYTLISIIILSLFVYTHVAEAMSFFSRIFGIVLGCIFGFSIFFIGLNIWTGQAWARLLTIIISSGVILLSIIAFFLGFTSALGSSIYFMTILVINVVIIWYLFSKHGYEHFCRKNTDLQDAIKEVIKKHYEEYSPDNQK